MSHDEPIYTTSGAARRLNISEGSVRRLANTGALPVFRTESGARLFLDRDLVEYSRQKAAAVEAQRK
ncbi:MAG: helix-turn-helix domain-containing protein [Chloroflexota bacterium]|nr:helix-turn-helix domain-containing protein [Acidobacteriota bacterium]MDQ3525305.1 helix-turn-helix domain-containing protein [Chloroflexota bacterium]